MIRRRRGCETSLFVLWGVLSLSGCVTNQVTLAKPAVLDVVTSSRRGGGREVALIRPFTDQREQRRRCGMRKNGYDMDVASVSCGTSPDVMLADLVAKELALAGFKVIPDWHKAGPSTIVLIGVLEQTFVEPKNNFFTSILETDIALKLMARTASGLRAERRFYVKGEETTFFASEDDIQKSFESAVRQLLASVAGGVANLAERFPVDGQPGTTPNTSSERKEGAR